MNSSLSYTRIVPQRLDFKYDEWKQLLEVPNFKRNGYQIDGQALHFGQVVGRFLGISHDEDEYYNLLFDVSQDPRVMVHVLSEKLDKTISSERFQAIQKVFMIHQNENGLSINRLVAFLKGYGLIPLEDNQLLHQHVQYTLIDVLCEFDRRHPHGLMEPEFRRVIIDLIKWMWNHLDPWMKGQSLDQGMPKVLWYGDATKSEIYFLYFLIKFGCDVVIFHPEGRDVLAEIDPGENLGVIYKYPEKSPVEEFPRQRRPRKSTVAHKASKEIERILNHDESLFYKPWQFRSYIPSSITLKTTYDELFIIAKAPAFIRPEFEVKDQQIRIPSLFAKVSGISKNRKEYWDRLRELTSGEWAVCIKHFPMTHHVQSNFHYHYQHALGSGGKLDPQKIMTGNWWKYTHLHSGLQLGIASAIARHCDEPRLKSLPGESLYDLQLFLFKQAFEIPESILNLLQKFDYSQHVPRLVLYNTEINGELSRTDAALLLLLNEFGIDIILFNPAGHNDLELYLEERYFDTHWLEEVTFKQEFIDEEPSLLRRVFKRLF